MELSELRELDELHALLQRSPGRLEDLIATVRERSGDDALERLAHAAALAGEVHQLSDDLLSYFVDDARQAGYPWSRIGTALGVSKQAAQQRFQSPDFSRYTDLAHRVLDSAAHAARRLRHSQVDSEHILIGLAETSDSVAAKALEGSASITSELLHEKFSGPGTAVKRPWSQTAPLTPRASKLLSELAPAEAAALGHNYVGPEHILLALLRRTDGRVRTLLAALSVDTDQLRAKVLELLSNS
jgi:hypothetical protein